MRLSLERYPRHECAAYVLFFISVVVVVILNLIGLEQSVSASSPIAPANVLPGNGVFTKGNEYSVKWTLVPGAVSYNYESYHDDSGNNKRWSANFMSAGVTFYNIADSTYWWRVQAVGAGGVKSDWSPLWKVTVDSASPAAYLSVSSPGAQTDHYGQKTNVVGSISDAEKNIASYFFEIRNPGGSITNIGPINTNSNNYVFPLNTFYGDGDYRITLTTTDKAGNSSKSSKTIVVDATAPLYAPVLTSEANRFMKPGFVARSWLQSSTEDVYSYYYKSFKSHDDALNNLDTANFNFSYSVIATNQRQYDLINQTGPTDRTFYYRVAAIDKAGNKTWSNEIHSVTVDGTPPPAPSLQINDLTNGALTNKTATASTWNKPSEDTLKYNLRYYTNIQGSSNTQATPSVTELTAEQWSGVLGEGTGQYAFQVQAIDRAGNESPWSDPFVINLDVTAPDAPALTVSDEKGNVATNATTKYPALTAEWNKPSDDTAKYTYQYWNDISTSPWKESTPNTFESTTQTWSGDLEGGSGTYYLRVQATDVAGNTSPWSDTFVINLDTIPPVVTVNPITSIETPNSATITAVIQDLTITEATIVITGATSGVVANAEVAVINGILTYELVTPAVDTYTVTVIAKDAADNETTSLAQTFAVKAPVVIVPEEKPAAPANPGSGNNTPATLAPAPADDTTPAGNTVAQNTAPDAEGEVFDDTDAAQNPQPRANTFVDGGDTDNAQEIQGTSDTKAFDWSFGVPLWGWLVAIGAIAGGWWVIAGVRRRSRETKID